MVIAVCGPRAALSGGVAAKTAGINRRAARSHDSGRHIPFAKALILWTQVSGNKGTKLRHGCVRPRRCPDAVRQLRTGYVDHTISFLFPVKGPVIKMSPHAALAAFLWLGAVRPGWAQSVESAEATVAEEQILGAADEETRAQELLPFTRSLSASGTVTGSLAESTAAAGIPPAAMLAALRAFDGATGPRTPQDGDAFFVRWEQTYSIEDRPIGVGRVLWAELRRADGSTVAIHRFRPREGGEQFFLTSGEAATPPAIALPLDEVNVSSRFGRRPDPLGAAMGGPLPNSRAARQAAAAARRGNRYFRLRSEDPDA